MRTEVEKLCNSTKVSLIITTVNAEMLRDIIYSPALFLMILTPWRMVQWFLENWSFTYPKNIALIKEKEIKKRSEIIRLFKVGVTDFFTITAITFMTFTFFKIPYLLMIF